MKTTYKVKAQHQQNTLFQSTLRQYNQRPTLPNNTVGLRHPSPPLRDKRPSLARNQPLSQISPNLNYRMSTACRTTVSPQHVTRTPPGSISTLKKGKNKTTGTNLFSNMHDSVLATEDDKYSRMVSLVFMALDQKKLGHLSRNNLACYRLHVDVYRAIKQTLYWIANKPNQIFTVKTFRIRLAQTGQDRQLFQWLFFEH